MLRNRKLLEGNTYSFGIDGVEVIGTITRIEEGYIVLDCAREYSGKYKHLRELGNDIYLPMTEVRWCKYA